MSFECSNPVWGITSNPHDKNLSPGGSSGGEAALIASGGSVIGIGR
jgi:fatty acid amide hydrolase